MLLPGFQPAVAGKRGDSEASRQGRHTRGVAAALWCVKVWWGCVGWT
jgi:hypothetical protein